MTFITLYLVLVVNFFSSYILVFLFFRYANDLYGNVHKNKKDNFNWKKNRSLRGHVLTGNKCYTINIVYVIVDMLL